MSLPKKLPFKKMNAFSDGVSPGNPAAVIYLDSIDDLSEKEMLKVALEMKGFVNEVGYVAQITNTRYRLRYFSSEREVEFCGHATIAIMFGLITENAQLMKEPLLTIETNKDVLRVVNRVSEDDAVLIAAPLPTFTPCDIKKESIENALNITDDLFPGDLPIEIINVGMQTLLLPITNLDGVLSISPDEQVLKQFCEENELDIIVVFSQGVTSPHNEYRTRVFAPRYGYLEDPATGSGNAALGYYLLKQQLWSGDVISIEQNAFLNDYNIIKLSTQKDPEGDVQVLFGGRAITKITGEYIL